MSTDALKSMLDQHLQQIEEHLGLGHNKVSFEIAEFLGIIGDSVRKLSSLDLNNEFLQSDLADIADALEGHQQDLEDEDEDDAAPEE